MNAHRSRVMSAGFSLLFTLPESRDGHHDLSHWLRAMEDDDGFDKLDIVLRNVDASADQTEVRLDFGHPFPADDLKAVADKARKRAEVLFKELAVVG